MANEIAVEVVYADRQRQFTERVPVPVERTVEAAIRCSGVLKCFPEIVLSQSRLGIYGRQVSLMDPVKAGDRIEIYRPLVGDPQAIRQRQMAQRQQRQAVRAID